MKPLHLPVFLLLFLGGAGVSQAQISSGSIYTIKAKSADKVLSIANSSVDNGAGLNTWTDTHSDAQRWLISSAGKNIYTLTNVGSGKLLHASAATADSARLDQTENTNADDVKWTIIKSGGSFTLKPAANPTLALNLKTGSESVVLTRQSADEGQKWVFQKQSPQDAAPTPAIAGQVFEAWYNGYQVETAKGFWDKAEMMEILLDAYEVTRDKKYLTKFGAMYDNFLVKNKTDWMYNKYNDDITWAVLFCVRGYLLTGNKTYLDKGKEQFDKMYARAFTNSYGGGLIWYETKTSKNACINGPAAVACCYLAQATGDKTYYDKAVALYSWSKLYLFNPETGKVNDNINFDRSGKIRTGTWSSTYNQGTYLGAAVMLYQYTKEGSYLAEAEKIAQYTRETMFKDGVMNSEDGGNDLPGFKGIFARYARKYATELGKTDLVDWMRLNAKVAYNNRNSAGIIGTKWGTKTEEVKPKSSFGTSTAVSLIMNTLVPGK